MDNSANKAQQAADTQQEEQTTQQVTSQAQNTVRQVQQPSATLGTTGTDVAPSASSENSQTQNVSATSSQQAPIQQPAGGPRNKEHEPTVSHFPDVTKMTEAEIVAEEKEVEKEIEKMVEKSPETEKPNIPKAAQDAGVTQASEDKEIKDLINGATPLPMSFEEAKAQRKKYGRQWFYWRKSVAWFAALIMYHWKKIKITASTVKNTEE